MKSSVIAYLMLFTLNEVQSWDDQCGSVYPGCCLSICHRFWPFFTFWETTLPVYWMSEHKWLLKNIYCVVQQDTRCQGAIEGCQVLSDGVESLPRPSKQLCQRKLLMEIMYQAFMESVPWANNRQFGARTMLLIESRIQKLSEHHTYTCKDLNLNCKFSVWLWQNNAVDIDRTTFHMFYVCSNMSWYTLGNIIVI